MRRPSGAVSSAAAVRGRGGRDLAGVAMAVRIRAGRGMATRLRRAARAALAVLRLGGAELSLVVVGDAEMRRLNCAHRGIDRTTDVLSFPLDGRRQPRARPWLLGDVVISAGEVRRQARAEGVPTVVVAERLLVHGLLHLVGYDHERSAAEARRMGRRERFVGAALRRARAVRRA
jgi:rRNA maturation RNase YbeY